MKKIAFFGTSAFGIPTLRKIHENFQIEFVVTGTAKPAHRGKKLLNSPIFEEAKLLGIERVMTPEKLTAEFEELVSHVDFAVVVSYGKILQEKLLHAVNGGDYFGRFLNIHPSSLPLFRGASPIERTLEAGHLTTHVCVINMEKELDSGNILAKEQYTITDENSIDLHEKFSHIGANLVYDILQNGHKINEKQEDGGTYARKITKNELELQQNTNLSCIEVLNKIRAFASYGFCFIIFENKRFKIIKAETSQKQKTKLDITCTDGYITPKILRPEGKPNMKIEDLQVML